jgi:histidine ammonia-lyase
MGEEQTVVISTAPLRLKDVLTVAEGAPVALAPQATQLIERSRAVVDAAIARGEAVYGVTTGVGHARNERLPTEALEALQPKLVEMHLGAIGDPMPTELVRAGMLVRLNGFARGGAGVSLEVAEAVAALLNHRIHPIIPRFGSVGAGDLGQLALLGRTLLGKGDVEHHGDQVAASDALSAAGLSPVTLRPKDALGIISSNALTVGHGITLWKAVTDLVAMADLVAATSMEAIGANPSFFEAAVAGARQSPGQIEVSRKLREALAGSQRVDATTASVQDPISFRVVPQVHGACRDVLSVFASDLDKELNATSDNPMVDIESGRILSNGNFHAVNLTLSAESLKLALAHVGLLSERRSGQLWDAAVSSLGAAAGGGEGGPSLDDGIPVSLAGLALRYPAAARYTRLRQIAQPVTLDVPSLDLNVEDHATNAAETLWTLREVVDLVTEILVVELLVSFGRLLLVDPAEQLGAGSGRVFELVDRVMNSLDPGTLPDETHHRVKDSLVANLNDLLDVV